MKKVFLLTLFLTIAIFMTGSPIYSQDAPSRTDAKILFLKGNVEVKAAVSGEWVKAYKDMELAGGDTIKTGDRSWAEVTFGNDLSNIVKVHQNTEITLSQIIPIRLKLLEGEIYSLIERLDSGSTFEVSTPTAVCGVRGSGQGTKTDRKSTTVSAFENDSFAKGINKDGSVMEPGLIIKQGFKSIIEKFKKPLKLNKIPPGEKRKWKTWRKKLQDSLAGAIGAGSSIKLEQLGGASGKFQKVMDTKEDILEKQDTDKIESRKKQQDSGEKRSGSYYGE